MDTTLKQQYIEFDMFLKTLLLPIIGIACIVIERLL